MKISDSLNGQGMGAQLREHTHLACARALVHISAPTSKYIETSGMEEVGGN